MAADVQGRTSLAGTSNGARRVLVLARKTDSPGGVVVFMQTIVRYLSPDWAVEWFVIGRRPYRRSPVVAAFQPVLDAWRLYRRLQRERYDVVHLNPTLGSRSVLRDGLFMLVMRLAGCRHDLVFFHGWDERLAGRVQDVGLLRWLFRETFGSARQILVLAPQFKKQLEAMGIDGGRVAVTTTMFDARLFRLPLPPEPRRSRRILFLSRLDSSKGVDVLLRAFERVSRTLPGTELVLAGDGPLRQGLMRELGRRQGAGRITLPGYVGGDEKARLLTEATVFVLPSRSEACPVAVLEAMAAGLPVVATRVGAIPLIVKEGVNGILLDDPTPDGLANALITLLSDRALSARMGRRNREVAWERYEASKVTALLEERYASVSLQSPRTAESR